MDLLRSKDVISHKIKFEMKNIRLYLLTKKKKKKRKKDPNSKTVWTRNDFKFLLLTDFTVEMMEHGIV